MPAAAVEVTDRDQRVAMVVTFLGIAAGSMALGELIYLAIRWIINQ